VFSVIEFLGNGKSIVYVGLLYVNRPTIKFPKTNVWSQANLALTIPLESRVLRLKRAARRFENPEMAWLRALKSVTSALIIEF
jgi:hypothetical protein